MKYFKLPTPKELGKSNSNALPIRALSPFEEGYSWEDWREEVKSKYPIKYFLLRTIPSYFNSHIIFRLRDLKYKIIDFFKKPHLLDMRCTDYAGGYLTPSSEIKFACFNSLKRYIGSNPYNLRKNYSEKEIDEQGLRFQQNLYDEASAIWNYWIIIKPLLEKEEQTTFVEMKNAAKNNDKNSYLSLKSIWHAQNIRNEQAEQNALERLIKIRESLW
ncbi:MAG: hypothetical protein Q8P20_00210 [bacterium]|nr:hypothetical protein [bacterium]